MGKKGYQNSKMIIIDGKAAFSTMVKLSENIRYEEDEGYLYCDNVVMGRTGTQDYKGHELEGLVDDVLEPNKIYTLHRDEKDVFHEDTLKSAKGKSVTYKHPNTSKVTSDNYRLFEVGTILDVWKDGDNIVGNIVIKDKNTINAILNDGIRELSLGYRANVVKKDDKYYQKDIYINHLAIVEHGRAGTARIMDSDSTKEVNKVVNKETNRFSKWLQSLLLGKNDDGTFVITDQNGEIIGENIMEDAIFKTISQYSSTRVDTYDSDTGESLAEEITHKTVRNTVEEYGVNQENAVTDRVVEEVIVNENVKDKETEKVKGDVKMTIQDVLKELNTLNTLPESEFKDKAIADLDSKAIEAGLGSIVPKKAEKTINDTMGTASNFVDVGQEEETVPKFKLYDEEGELESLQAFSDSFDPANYNGDTFKLREKVRNYRPKTVRQIIRGGK